MKANVQVIVGKDEVIDLLMIALIASGMSFWCYARYGKTLLANPLPVP